MDQSTVSSLATLCFRKLDSFNLLSLTKANIPLELKKKAIIHYLLFNCAGVCDYCDKFRSPLAEKYNPIKKTSKYTCRDCFECNGNEDCNGTFKKYIVKCQKVGYVCATCGCECSMGVGCGIYESMYEWAKLPVKPEWVSEYNFYMALKLYPEEIKDPQIIEFFKARQIEEGIGVPEGIPCPQREAATMRFSSAGMGWAIEGTPFRIPDKRNPTVTSKYSNGEIVPLSDIERKQCQKAGWRVEDLL